MRTKSTRLRAAGALLLALALSLSVAACGSSSNDSSSNETKESNGAGAIVSNPENGKVSLTIGSKNFPEQEILGEIYAQGLKAAGYKVKSDLNLGSETVAHKAVQSGAISGYPEYASTALTSFFGLEPEEVPSDGTEAWEKANEEFEKENLVAFEPTPFASANAVGVATAGGGSASRCRARMLSTTSRPNSPAASASAQAASTASSPASATSVRISTNWRSPSSWPASRRRICASASGRSQLRNGSPLRSAPGFLASTGR